MKKRYPNLKGSLFIVTYGRSGSTILQSLLQTIPGAHITGENNNALVHLSKASDSIRQAKDTWGKKKHPPTHPWYGADQFHPRQFEKRLARLFVEDVLQPPKDVNWLGFKEIRYPAVGKELPKFLKFCRRNFPNAHIVFNSRNAEDVAKSKWWARQPKDKVLKMVADMDATFTKFSAANPEFAHHVRYEEIVADPAVLKPLFAALDEDLDLTKAQSILKRKLTH